MDNEEKIKQLLSLVKIIRNDFLMIDNKGEIYKISKTDYYLLNLIKTVKKYEKIKQILRDKFQNEEKLERFLDNFLDKYLETLGGSDKSIANQKE